MKNAPLAVLGLLAAVGSAYTPTQHPRFRRGFNSLSPREEAKPKEQPTLTPQGIVDIMKNCPKNEEEMKTKKITEECYNAAKSGLAQMETLKTEKDQTNFNILKNVKDQMDFNEKNFPKNEKKERPVQETVKESQESGDKALPTPEQRNKIMKECPTAEPEKITKECYDTAVSALNQLAKVNLKDQKNAGLKAVADKANLIKEGFEKKKPIEQSSETEEGISDSDKELIAGLKACKTKNPITAECKRLAQSGLARLQELKTKEEKSQKKSEAYQELDNLKANMEEWKNASTTALLPDYPVVPDQQAEDFPKGNQTFTACIKAKEKDSKKDCKNEATTLHKSCGEVEKSKMTPEVETLCAKAEAATGDPDAIKFPKDKPVVPNQNTEDFPKGNQTFTACIKAKEKDSKKDCKNEATTLHKSCGEVEKSKMTPEVKTLCAKAKAAISGETANPTAENGNVDQIQANFTEAAKNLTACAAKLKDKKTKSCENEERAFIDTCLKAKKPAKESDTSAAEVQTVCDQAKADIISGKSVDTSTASSATNPNASGRSIQEIFDQLNKTTVALQAETNEDKKQELAAQNKTLQAEFEKACPEDIKKRNSTKEMNEAKTNWNTKMSESAKEPKPWKWLEDNVKPKLEEYFKFANMTIEESLCNHKFAQAERTENEVKDVQSGKTDSTQNASGTATAKQGDVTVGVKGPNCQSDKSCSKSTIQASVKPTDEKKPAEVKPADVLKAVIYCLKEGRAPVGYKVTFMSFRFQESEKAEAKEMCKPGQDCMKEVSNQNLRKQMDLTTAQIEPKTDSGSASNVPPTPDNMANKSIQVSGTKKDCKCTIDIFFVCPSDEPEKECINQVTNFVNTTGSAANPPGPGGKPNAPPKFTIQKVQVKNNEDGTVDATKSCGGEGGKKCDNSDMPTQLQVSKVAPVKVDQQQQVDEQGLVPANPSAIDSSSTAPNTLILKVSCCPPNEPKCTNPTIKYIEITIKDLKEISAEDAKAKAAAATAGVRAGLEAGDDAARKAAEKQMPRIGRVFDKDFKPTCEQSCEHELVYAPPQKVQNIEPKLKPASSSTDGSSGNSGLPDGDQRPSKTTPTECKTETVTKTVTETVTPTTCGTSESNNRGQTTDQVANELKDEGPPPQENEKSSGDRNNRDTTKVSNPDEEPCPEDETPAPGNKTETTTGNGENNKKLTDDKKTDLKLEETKEKSKDKPKDTTQTSQGNPPKVNPPEDTPGGGESSDTTSLPPPKRNRKNL